MRTTRIAVGVLLLFLASCERESTPATQPAGPNPEVVVYTSLDQQFSEPILREFTRRTGIAVRPAYDTESTKTVGLANRIRAEAARPRCDVFWNNEVVNTVRLKQEGLLQPLGLAEIAHIPAALRDPEGYWCGFAARARVLLVNTDLVPADQRPTSIRALADPRWRGRIGMAKPLFGSTATHVAFLFAKLGDAEAAALLRAIRANDAQILSGNKGVAEAVGAGRLAIGLTDTDDAVAELDAGRRVAIIFPDSEPGGMGTLVFPNTVALIKGAPHVEAGRRLVEYLLSPEVEAELARGPSAQIPLHVNATATSRVGRLAELRPMEVDFGAAAAAFQRAARFVEQEFLAP